MTISRSTDPKGRKARLLELARQIAQGKKAWISPSYLRNNVITSDDYAALVDLSGEEELYFDDTDYLSPTEEDRHPRVMFLCMALEAL